MDVIGDISIEDALQFILDYNTDEIQELDCDELYIKSKEILDIWCPESFNQFDIAERNFTFFGTQNDAKPRRNQFMKIPFSMLYRVYAIEFEDNGLQPEDNKDLHSEFKSNIVKIIANITWAYESMGSIFRQLNCVKKGSLDVILPLSIDRFTSVVDIKDMKPHQKLLRYLLNVCDKRNYRKCGTELFEPKFTENGDFTRTYIHVCSITQFIYEAIEYTYKDGTEWMWLALTDSNTVSKICTAHLENCCDDQLPTLILDRTKFSFKNGIFDADENKFYEYSECANLKPYTCANFIDVHFENDIYTAKMDEFKTPLAIPTPNIQHILNSQELGDDVCLWFYASMGRMVFDVGTKDNWQYFPFCKGTAGSGKSTILRLASKFYTPLDIGNLMSEGQKTFSIEHIYDRFMFFCYDVDDKMNFSLTRWNQMVSGETIAIERKFKIPIQKKWSVPGGFAGNSYPPWIDQAGNVSRRMLIFLFCKVVTVVDPNLETKCDLELGAFLKKCISCYFLLLERHGNRGIWDSGVLPEYFHETRRNMQSETNPLQAFIHSDQCDIGIGKHVSYSLFRSAYLLYCESFRLTKKPIGNEDQYNPIFVPHGIQIIKPVQNREDEYGYMSKYVLGLTLQE